MQKEVEITSAVLPVSSVQPGTPNMSESGGDKSLYCLILVLIYGLCL
jgi:hypothetical protein